ncbi:MBL fold metallo-hydrolase [Desulfurobacterium thermolithotrophum]|uniref:MBL fold metallo-hydrolase n=1 Tax=Desulfurobacterium thermolithotrophum TaxID=64160 RepID=UPI0013D3D821|nr:MBL fold metallo-hydrolase [Desulfurobacterium thermolithotrophum]
MENLKILYDNRALSGYREDWGFAALIELSDETILFDTGAKPEVLAENLKKFGVNIEEVDVVFISHNHWDHIGGLPYILKKNKDFELFVPEPDCVEFEENLPESVVCVPITTPTYISERAVSTGIMETGIEKPSFEHSLIVSTAEGFVLLTGCSHPGIVEIAKKATEICGEELFLIVGGFHLYKSPDEKIIEVAEELKIFTRFVAPCHCTGERGIELFKEILKDRFVEAAAGVEILF